jgi:hypothetical protein
MVENQTDGTQEEIKKEDSPWTTIAYGVAFIAGGIFLYYTFDNMEKEGGSMRLNWMFALAYKIGGKWTVAIILALFGSFLTYSGVSDMIKKKQN